MARKTLLPSCQCCPYYLETRPAKLDTRIILEKYNNIRKLYLSEEIAFLVEHKNLESILPNESSMTLEASLQSMQRQHQVWISRVWGPWVELWDRS
jgi:hypothetical protein